MVKKVGVVMSYSDMERELDRELETKSKNEIQNEVKNATSQAIDNVFLLSDLTFKLGTELVNKELKAIFKKYNMEVK